MNRLVALTVAALSGFLGLSWEVVWLRAFDLATAGRAWVFGVVVAVYLVGLATGARFAQQFVRVPMVRRRWGLAVALFAASVLAWAVVPGLAELVATKHSALWALAPLFLAASCAGLPLPLVTEAVGASTERPTHAIALTYAANTLGSTLGPLVTTLVVFEHLTLAQTARLLLVTGATVSVSLLPLTQLQRLVVACTVLGGLWPLHTTFYAATLQRLMARSEPFARTWEGRAGVVALTQRDVVYGGGAYDGALNTSLAKDENTNGIDRAYVVALLRPDARHVLEIGLSGGAWANVLAGMPQLESLTSVELNPAYLSLIDSRAQVRSILRDGKVRLVVADGRAWLTAHPEARFDLVVMNASFHWRAGMSHLLSQESLRLIRSRLTPTGVVYLNTTGSPEVLRTVATVFPFTATYKNFVAGGLRPFELDRERFAQALRQWRVGGRSILEDDVTEDDLDALAAAAVGGDRDTLLEKTRGARVITDDAMTTEFQLGFAGGRDR